MQNIDTYNFLGKKALIRVDFNVPLNDKKEIIDDTRIKASIPTLKKVIEKGGTLILMAHMGKPKGPSEDLSLKHTIKRIEQYMGLPVKFAPDCMNADDKVKNLKTGEILLLENLRFYAEEECKPRGLAKDVSDKEKDTAKKELKESQKKFCKKLASYADCYINDAFGTAHRKHASTAIIAEYFPNDKMFGYLMEQEIKAINKILKNPQRPLTAIMGGAKVSSKIGIIEHLLDFVDNLLITGGMVFTFKKALGGKIGDSLFEENQVDTALKTIKLAKEKNVKLYFSDEVVAADRFSNDAKTIICSSDNIPDGWMGLDASDKTLKEWSKVIKKSKTILWNGPIGVFEMPNFSKGTKIVAQLLAEATDNGTYTLVGGGDSVAALSTLGFKDRVSYVSTGGGAMLESFEGKTLPGIKAILD
ncbi:MAG: phosphoglycerate kinase [Bacteroidales bacterium]